MSKNGFSVRSAVLRAVAVALALSFCVGASAQDTCESEGVEFGFFNGVDTEEDFAQKVVEEFLPPLYGPTTPKGQPITYTLYYNDTEGLSDFVEVFEPRWADAGVAKRLVVRLDVAHPPGEVNRSHCHWATFRNIAGCRLASLVLQRVHSQNIQEEFP